MVARNPSKVEIASRWPTRPSRRALRHSSQAEAQVRFLPGSLRDTSTDVAGHLGMAHRRAIFSRSRTRSFRGAPAASTQARKVRPLSSPLRAGTREKPTSVAHSVEHLSIKQKVAGSTPVAFSARRVFPASSLACSIPFRATLSVLPFGEKRAPPLGSNLGIYGGWPSTGYWHQLSKAASRSRTRPFHRGHHDEHTSNSGSIPGISTRSAGT